MEVGKDESFDKKLENSKQDGELGSIRLSIGAHEVTNRTRLRKFSESTDCSFEFDSSLRCKERSTMFQHKICSFEVVNRKKVSAIRPKRRGNDRAGQL